MMDWQPIETIPIGIFVDVWVISKNNPDWGKRLTDVCKNPKHSSGWVGIENHYLTDDVHPALWFQVDAPSGL